MSQSSIILTIIAILSGSFILVFIFSNLFGSWVKRVIDKALSKSHFSQAFILAFTIVFVFLLLVLLSTIFSPLKDGQFMARFWNALSHFFNPGSFNRDESGDIPNVWIVFINVFGMILMTGLLISVLSNLLERRVDNLKSGRIYYQFKDHFVIIGYDRMAISLIKQLAKKQTGKNIILQTVQDVPTVRHEVFSYLNKETEKYVLILNGNRNSKEDLEKLSLHRANALFVLGETEEYDHDSLNIECLKKINKILCEKSAEPEKPCHVLFENQSTYAILQQQDLMTFLDEHNEACKENEARKLDFLPFNFQELWAQKVFVDNTYNCPDDESENIHYLPLDRDGIDYDSDKTVHLVVIGMSKIGIALGVQASHLCHFPNFVRDPKLKTKITFIDENADREMHFLQGRYRRLLKEIDYSYEDIYDADKNFNNLNEPNTKDKTTRFTDIEWHFIKGSIEEPGIQQKLVSYSNENTCLTIALCLNLPAAAIASGLYLPEEVYKESIQILIRQDTPYSILSMLKPVPKYINVKPFGMLDNCLDLGKADNKRAKIVHYIYEYFFGEKTSGQIPQKSPTDKEYETCWRKLPTAHKWSNIYHADMIHTKLRFIDKDKPIEEQIELIAEVEHNRWNTEKLIIGYRPTTKDEDDQLEAKTINKKTLKENFIHPDIKEYSHLSEDMKNVDRMISKAIPLIRQIIN